MQFFLKSLSKTNAARGKAISKTRNYFIFDESIKHQKRRVQLIDDCSSNMFESQRLAKDGMAYFLRQP